MKKQLFSLTVLLSFLASCNILNINPENTIFKVFSCKMNGKTWIPGTPSGYKANTPLIYGLVYKDVVSIDGYLGYLKSSVLMEDSFSLSFSAEEGIGKKTIDENSDFLYAILKVSKEGDVIERYELDKSAGGFIEITDYQPEYDYCSGQFEFTLKEINSGKLRKVTKGNFRISTTEFYR